MYHLLKNICVFFPTFFRYLIRINYLKFKLLTFLNGNNAILFMPNRAVCKIYMDAAA